MAELLKGAPVSAAMIEDMKARCDALAAAGMTPTLAVVRIGAREDDLSYERGILKRCEQVGVKADVRQLPADVSAEEYYAVLRSLAADDAVHGILTFRPLPAHIDDRAARALIPAAKDVDGCTDASLAGVFTGSGEGFAPCTAEAVLRIFDYYGIDVSGKRVTVIGRSLVIGRPVAMMLMARGATPTICHTKTVNVPDEAAGADIIIAAAGQMESVDGAFVREGQIVIDVGIAWNDKKSKLCGDVDFDAVAPVVSAITPVPGGVGAVTTSVLISHVITAAER